MANKETTAKLKKELAFDFSSELSDKFFEYLDKVLEKNEHINLTAVKDRDEAAQKHIADSLSVTKLEEYRNAKNVIDVGTGAGFPGALLAIASPDKGFTLLDSTNKRLKVIEEIAAEIEINNINTLHARAEEINKKPEYNGNYDLCVSRAVANLTTLVDWCLPFVRTGGAFIAYKGENYQEELELASTTIAKHGATVDRIEKLPDDYREISGHTLIVIKK